MGSEMPSSVHNKVSWFDRFARTATTLVSQPWFFAACVLLILVWAPSILVLPDVDTWQLIINTATTIVTFLLVALLQNTQERSDKAVQHKLNAIADGLANLMTSISHDHPRSKELRRDVSELRQAVGLEERESA